MDKKSISQTIIISIMFFLTLSLVALSTQLFPKDGGFKLEPIHVFIALIPFVVLLIASGKLKEVKGPGGITLSMRDEVQKPISMEFKDTALEIDPEVVQSKGGIESLGTTIAENPPTTLSFQLGKMGYYGQWAIEEYMRELKKYPAFHYILFTDLDGRFQGYMNIDEYTKVLNNRDDIVADLESGNLLYEKSVKKNSIRTSFTNKQALDAMETKNVNELAVVDEADRFVGLITQEEIVRKILTKIIREV